MFGYIVANKDKLTPEESQRYEAMYCGLCRTIGSRHGNAGRLTLTYDMVFLIILLGAVSGDAEEQTETGKCRLHPKTVKSFTTNKFTSYAADMNVALSYYKLLDDWQDEKKSSALAAAKTIEKSVKKIEKEYPQQCKGITDCLASLSEIEKRGVMQPDIPANVFGELMGSIFKTDESDAGKALASFGSSLGRFIYVLDAACDLKEDIKKERYNPLLHYTEDTVEPVLNMLMAECIDAFVKLDIKSDRTILDNILYSGVWSGFAVHKSEKERKRGEII